MIRQITPVNIDGIGEVSLGYGSYSGGLRTLIPKQTAIEFFKKGTLRSIGVFDNQKGIFSISNDIVSGKIVFMSFFAAQFGLRPSGNGCQWEPSTKVFTSNNGFRLYPIKQQWEQCPDELMGSCFRYMLGKGNNIENILATEDGQKIFQESLIALFEQMGYDINALIWIGNHPLIKSAFDAGVSGFDDYTAKNFYLGNYDVERYPSGFLTTWDQLKATGAPNFNVDIDPSGLQGKMYDGDVFVILNALKSAAPARFRSSLYRRPQNGVYLLKRNLFDRLGVQMGAYGLMNGNVDLVKALFIGKNEDIGYDGEMMMYNGHTILPMDIWDVLDEGTRTLSARAAFVHIGNLGVGFDIPRIENAGDIAMDIEQRLGPGPGNGGMVYGQSKFELGLGIIDKDFMTYGSYVTTIEE